jgi:hypothetical protein
MSKSLQEAVIARSAGKRGRLGALMLAAGSLAVMVALTASSGAAAGSRITVVLGNTAIAPNPSCPGSPCQAIGSVTGFQVSNGQTSLPYSVPRDGKIKAWTLTLAQPTNQQRSFFNGFFGTPPEARLAVLKRIAGTNPPRYNLVSQGSIHVLSPYLGQTVKFSASLDVEKGDIIGLTVPTWAPAFAEEQPTDNVWRASRAPGKCTNSNDLRQGEPQMKVGKRATYGCRYTTARLLYTATLVSE